MKKILIVITCSLLASLCLAQPSLVRGSYTYDTSYRGGDELALGIRVSGNTVTNITDGIFFADRASDLVRGFGFQVEGVIFIDRFRISGGYQLMNSFNHEADVIEYDVTLDGWSAMLEYGGVLSVGMGYGLYQLSHRTNGDVTDQYTMNTFKASTSIYLGPIFISGGIIVPIDGNSDRKIDNTDIGSYRDYIITLSTGLVIKF